MPSCRIAPATYTPVLETYGVLPSYAGTSGAVPPGAASPLHRRGASPTTRSINDVAGDSAGATVRFSSAAR